MISCRRLAPAICGTLSLLLVAGVFSGSQAASAEAPWSSNHWAGATITYVSNATANNGNQPVQAQPVQTTDAQAQPVQATQAQDQPAPSQAGHTEASKTGASDAYASPLFACQDGVTAQFITEISQDAAQLPETWKGKLTKAGYKIAMSRTLFDSVPSARGQQVRGYKSSATWSQVFGMFDRRRRRVVMAELAKQTENEKSALVTLNDQQTRAGILRHEFGHAIDDYLRYPSHGRSFAQAYAVGVPRLNAHDKTVLNYYLQVGIAGKEEMFAELFAIKGGVACDPIADDLLRQKFPEAMSVVNSTISDTTGA